MSLNHKFYVVPKSDTHKDNISRNHYVKSGYAEIILEDDFILYIYDSFKWIRTFNPFKNEYLLGLNYHGVTLFEDDSIKTMHKIINAWKLLFENATEEFILKGRYIMEEDKGYYNKLKLKKETIIKTLSYFCNILEEALQQNKNIVHFGI